MEAKIEQGNMADRPLACPDCGLFAIREGDGKTYIPNIRSET